MLAVHVGVQVELRDAYEKLGVEPGIEPKKARRAYLKLLKVHKPERDPEGFKAIRAAWERIKDAPEWEIRSLTEAPLPPADPQADQPAVSSWSKPKRSWAEQAQLSREGKLFKDEPPPAPVPAVPPAPIDPDAPVTMATFYARCSGATDAQRVAIGREAVATLPNDPEAHWLLHESLLVTSQMEEAAKALRAAHESGLGGFFEPLVRQHSEFLSPIEIEAAVQLCGDTLDALMVAEAMLRCDHAQAAGDAMRRGFEAARRGGEPPSLRRCIDLVLRLYRQEHAGVAHQLYSRLSEWMRESGAEREIAGSQVAATYALLRELAALPVDFPFEIKGAIARGILDGDVAFAIGDVMRWLEGHAQHREGVESKLVLFAPTIHVSLRPAFQQQQPSNQAFMPGPQKIKSWGGAKPQPHPLPPIHNPPPANNYGKWIGLAIALFVFVAVQIALRQSRPRYEPPPITQFESSHTQRIRELARLTEQMAQAVPVTAAELDEETLRATVDQLCGDPGSELCLYAKGWADALGRTVGSVVTRDCVVAADQRLGFQHAVEQDDRGALTDVALRTFERVHAERCPTPTP